MEKLWLFVHEVGIIFGAGSVTTAYARELYFRFNPHQMHGRGYLPIISIMINIAFALLIISGFGLYMTNPQKYNGSSYFGMKIVLIIILLVNHVAINAFIRGKKNEMKFVHTVSEYISLLGWYAVIAASILI